MARTWNKNPDWWKNNKVDGTGVTIPVEDLTAEIVIEKEFGKNDHLDVMVNEIMTEVAIKDGIGFFNNSYSPHDPYTRQVLFLEHKDETNAKNNNVPLEMFYGGAAGGGKSDAILMAALEYVHVKGYAALILRKTFADLSKPGAIMDRAHTWLKQTDAKWQEKTKTYTFPSGATLTFGYMESENDKYNYQSSEFQFIGFDELSHFTFTQYTYMFSRLRRLLHSDVPIRMRSGSNPPQTVSGMWLKERFVPDDFVPEMADEPVVFTKYYYDEETGIKKHSYFVPARMDDNPHLDQESYEEALGELDYVTRMQLRRGDWQISVKGDILFMWSEPHSVITWSAFNRAFGLPSWNRSIPLPWKLGVFQDWGTTKGHPCVTGWFATAPQGSPVVNGVDLSGLVFWYRTLVKTTQCSAKRIKEKIFDVMIPDYEVQRCQQWEMSHEASSEREEYNDPDPETGLTLPFSNWQTGKTRGIESLKTAITPMETQLQNPFNPTVMGYTKLMLIVEDNELYNPKVITDDWDKGQSRVRLEFPAYKWHENKSGEAKTGPNFPHPLFNDACDVARGAAASYFPMSEEESAEDKIKKELKKSLPNVIFNDNMNLSEGSQLALILETARVRRQLAGELDFDEYGQPIEVTGLRDLSQGW